MTKKAKNSSVRAAKGGAKINGGARTASSGGGAKSGKPRALTSVTKALAALRVVAPPPIPTQALVGEARALAKVADKYERELRAVGLDGALARSLTERTDALAEAQSELALVRGKRRGKQEIDMEKQAVAMRRDMVADGRYALRDDADAQATIDHVQEGDGLDDLVQDLRDMASFHATHKKELAKIGVDAGQKAKAAQALAGAFADALAERRAGDAVEKTALDARDRAATYLVAAMKEVRDAGIYAFRNKPEIAARFRGTYQARHHAKKKKPATPVVPPPAPGTAAKAQ